MVKMFDLVNWRNAIPPWLVHVGQACKMIQPKRDYLQQIKGLSDISDSLLN